MALSILLKQSCLRRVRECGGIRRNFPIIPSFWSRESWQRSWHQPQVWRNRPKLLTLTSLVTTLLRIPSNTNMQSSAHPDEQVDAVSEASSSDDSISWGRSTKLRVTAATLFAIGISPYFGVGAMHSLQVSFLLLDVLCIIPFMAYCDEIVNWVWGRQPVRFFAGGRVVWVLLALRGIPWSQAFFTACYQIVSQPTRWQGVYTLIGTRVVALGSMYCRYRVKLFSLPSDALQTHWRTTIPDGNGI